MTDLEEVPDTSDNEYVDQLLAVARKEKGNHEEDGPNNGTCLKYQKVTGNGPGDSWCVSFICWCFKAIGLLKRLPRVTGSCEYLRVAARKAGKLYGPETPVQPGDIILVVTDRATNTLPANHAHHVAIVADYADEDTQIFPTIEGNSNDNGSSNGVGVYERNTRGGENDPALKNNHYEIVRVFESPLV